MNENDGHPNDVVESNPRVSRREILGITTVSAAGLGVIGLAATSQRASAQVGVDFGDASITLTPDDEVSSVMVAGTVEASYQAGDADVESATLNVTVGDTAGEGVAGGNQSFTYDDVDSDSDEITQDVSISFSVPPEVADPDEGSAIETEFFVDVMFFVDDADGELITEAINNDTATLRFEREADDDTGEENGSEPAGADVGGSFTFDVDVE